MHIDFDGLWLEIPRYVHHASAEARLVSTETELREALADGFAIDPNALPAPSPEQTVELTTMPADDRDAVDISERVWEQSSDPYVDRVSTVAVETVLPKRRGRPPKVRQ